MTKIKTCGILFSVIAMGGDGTVNQVLNGLMNRSQKEQDVEKRPGFTPVRALIPMGIIPIGKTNHIAYSLMGTADPITAGLRIIFGELGDCLSLGWWWVSWLGAGLKGFGAKFICVDPMHAYICQPVSSFV